MVDRVMCRFILGVDSLVLAVNEKADVREMNDRVNIVIVGKRRVMHDDCILVDGLDCILRFSMGGK